MLGSQVFGQKYKHTFLGFSEARLSSTTLPEVLKSRSYGELVAHLPAKPKMSKIETTDDVSCFLTSPSLMLILYTRNG